MKYNFVHDADFLEKNFIYLSVEEKEIVFETVVGKHNAIFYGYKPERLIKAIKKLTGDNPFVEISSLPTDAERHKAKDGVVYMKDFDSWGIIDQQYLYSFSRNDKERLAQFIATATENPLNTVVPDMINNFDIIYECKKGDQNHYAKWYINTTFREVYEFHRSLHSGKSVTSTELEVANYWLFDDAYSYINKLAKNNPVLARKVAMVSRSVSDCNFESLTDMGDVRIAERLVGVCQ